MNRQPIDPTTVTMPISEYERLMRVQEEQQKDLNTAMEGEAHNANLVSKKDEQLRATLELFRILFQGWSTNEEVIELLNKILSLQERNETRPPLKPPTNRCVCQERA